jgi:hypothetical protein
VQVTHGDPMTDKRVWFITSTGREWGSTSPRPSSPGNAVEAKDLQEQGEGLPRSVDLTCTG